MAHKRGFTEPMSTRIEEGLIADGVTTMHGLATFTGPTRLDVDGISHSTSHFPIATGARPRPLPFPGAEHMIDSTAFLELEALPERILFIGGGFISFEFAHIAARAGSETTILHHSARPLRGFDPDLVRLLVDRSRAVGIDVRLDTAMAASRPSTTGSRCTPCTPGSRGIRCRPRRARGKSRIPDLDRLALDAAGIAHDEHGDRLVTSRW